MDAPSTSANSFAVNIDAPPQGPTMIWDILPITSGFEQRIVSWRGSGTANSDQFVPKVFGLSAGAHQICFKGEGPGTSLSSFTLLQVLPAAPAAQQSMPGRLQATMQAKKNLSYTNTQTLTASPPLITSTPTNYVVVAGQTIALNAAATGNSSLLALAYQWRFNSVDLPMASNATLMLKNVTTNQSGTYTLSVSDGDETTISSPVMLTVYPTAAATLAMAAHAKNQFGLSLSGVPGYQYEVQASTNLVDWVPIQTNVAPFLFIDPDAGKFQQRFYRSRYVPVP